MSRFPTPYHEQGLRSFLIVRIRMSPPLNQLQMLGSCRRNTAVVVGRRVTGLNGWWLGWCEGRRAAGVVGTGACRAGMDEVSLQSRGDRLLGLVPRRSRSLMLSDPGAGAELVGVSS